MAEDINSGFIVGRITRDAELSYTNGGTALSKFAIAVNKSKKVNDQWTEEGNFFDFVLWGRRAEGLNQYLVKGQQVAINYSLKQERWEQDGNKRSKVGFDIVAIELVGSNRNTSPQEQRYNPQSGTASGSTEDDIPF